MAGIGFELKKLFTKQGIIRSARAYSFATIICAGPMLFGILLVFGIMFICSVADVYTSTRVQLISMITYTMLASVVISSTISMVVTRYASDMLSEDKNEKILPAFWGSNILMMALGSLTYGIFLLVSGATLVQQMLCFILFNELIIVWNSMNFLSAIKDYKGIILSFLTAVAVSFLSGAVLLFLFHAPIVEALIFAVGLGYGVMMVWNILLLHRYFPASNDNAFDFLRWLDKYKSLALSGFFINIAMFIHIVVVWFSDIGVHCMGLFYSAPYYDVPALFAYMTTLMTTVSFVVSVEVNFYPKYKTHYSLYNDMGMIKDIKHSEQDMLRTLKNEIFYTALKQLLFSAAFIAIGGHLLDVLPLGFNEIMRGFFRTLCVAYGLYATGNMLMLLLMYFTDYKGTMISTGVFLISTVAFSLLSLLFPSVYYGFGFLISSIIFVVVALWRLNYYTKHLAYYILSTQPLVSENQIGPFEKFGVALDKGIRKIGGKKGETK